MPRYKNAIQAIVGQNSVFKADSDIMRLFFLLLIYAAFLFVVPSAVNLNTYKGEVQKIVKENVNLELDFGYLQYRLRCPLTRLNR